MKQIRKRLTYANVMSTIAVFLILGGATAFAASTLGKNTVGSKQLKKNSVTTNKIKKEAVTGAKVKKGTLTGTQINLAKLGTVPNANHAATADNAGTAGNATTTNGIHSAKLDFLSGENAPATTVFSADGLTLTAECNSSNLEFTGRTSVSHAEIYESGNYLSEYNGAESSIFEIGDVEKVGETIGDHSQDEVQGQLVYSNANGAIVTIQFALNDSTVNGGLSTGCSVKGIAQFS